MAGIIRTLFKSKKSKKEEAQNVEDLARDVSNRRSFRAPSTSSSSKSQRRAVARFADDDIGLSATSAYHTTTAPKLRKGPKSCPGGYRDESDVSYESDKYSQKSSSQRRRDVLQQSMRYNYTIDEGRKPSNSGRRHHSKSEFGKRMESSEYGSGDPSPIGQYSSRHSHYEDRIEESENDEFSEKAKFAVLQRGQEHYIKKYRESEHKRREDKRKMKEMEKENNDTKNAMFHYMNQLDKMKKERDCWRKEANRYKKQLEQIQNNGYDASFHHHRQPQMSNPQQYPPALTMGYNFMNQPMNTSHLMQASFMNSAPPSSNTPMTMTSGGAGESLTNPSDVSFLQNSFMQPTSQLLSGMTPSPGFKVPINFGDDDADEVKDYRSELTIETSRSQKTNDDISISPSSSADSQVTLLDHSRIIQDKENRKPPNRSFSMMSI